MYILYCYTCTYYMYIQRKSDCKPVDPANNTPQNIYKTYVATGRLATCFRHYLNWTKY